MNTRAILQSTLSGIVSRFQHILRPGLEPQSVGRPVQASQADWTEMHRFEQREPGPVARAQSPDEPSPELVEFYDKISDKTDSVMTPGGKARLIGLSLSFELPDKSQGLFLMDSSGESIRIESIEQKSPTEIHFLIPPLGSGEYILELRARIGKEKPLIIGTLPATLQAL